MSSAPPLISALLRVACMGTIEGLALDALDRLVAQAKTERDRKLWRGYRDQAEAKILEIVGQEGRLTRQDEDGGPE